MDTYCIGFFIFIVAVLIFLLTIRLLKDMWVHRKEYLNPHELNKILFEDSAGRFVIGFIIFTLFAISMLYIIYGYLNNCIGYVSAGFSGFAAFGTILMAIFTFRIIVQNKEERQESHKPYCVLVSNSNSSHRQDWIFGKSMNVPGSQGTFESLTESCIKIKNIGTGPALDIKIEIQLECKEYKNNPLFNVTPIAPGELPYEIDLGELNRDNFKRFYVIHIKYSDIFGNIFEGVYPGKHGEDITLDMHTKKPVNSEYEIVYQRAVK